MRNLVIVVGIALVVTFISTAAFAAAIIGRLLSILLLAGFIWFGYVMWTAAFVHGIAAGTDSGAPVGLATYGAAGGVVAAAMWMRLRARRNQPAPLSADARSRARARARARAGA